MLEGTGRGEREIRQNPGVTEGSPDWARKRTIKKI